MEFQVQKEIHLQVGEKLHIVNSENVTPETTLNKFLRDISHYTGTKKMCLEGGCGTCIVAVEELRPKNNVKKVFAVNSCLVSIFSCHGWKVHTIEGIGGPTTKYHPLQTTLAEKSGSQCGYCSAGMVMNMFALLENGPLTKKQVENSFGGNICRCTGYRPILDAFKSFASDSDSLTDIEEYKQCNKTKCENSCPTPCLNKKPLAFSLNSSNWIKVFFIKDLMDVLANSTGKTYQLVAGNTGRGVYRIKEEINTYIDVTNVAELTAHTVKSNQIILGGNVSLTNTMDIFYSAAKNNKDFSFLSQLADHIDLVANVPVRNIGTLAGNLMVKHQHQEFQSDIFLILETVNAELVIVDTSLNETRVSPGKFLNLDMKKKVIKQIIIRSYNSSYLYRSYKIMTRAQNTHALVNAGFLFQMNGETVQNARIVYGSINPKFVHAVETENYLKNKTLFNNDVLQQCYTRLDKELNTVDDPPEPNPVFRKQLAIALFYKFVLSIAPSGKVGNKMKSGGILLERPLSSGTQEFTTNKALYPVTKPIPKVEALAQTSGQAEYVADIPDLPFQLYASFVTAKAPAGSKIGNVDTTAALKLKGVVSYIDKSDVKGANTFVPAYSGLPSQEELFCSGTVQFFFQPIGIILAEDLETAEKASELVKVTYTNTDGPIYLTIEDVLKADKKDRLTHKVDYVSKKKGTDIKKTIEGTLSLPTQAHFHMEVQTCNVYPKEDGLEIICPSQFPDINQLAAASACNLSTDKVSVFTRRLGGGFGGKIFRTSQASTAAAVAAWKLRRPVKIWNTLEKNMNIFGKRMPLVVKYKVDVDDQGLIQHMQATLYTDYGVEGGNADIYTMLLASFLNGYKTETWDFTIYSVKTDTPTNCWTRAPGTLEGTGAIEIIMEHIASVLNKTTLQVQEVNLDIIQYPDLKKYVDYLKGWSQVVENMAEINKFNSENRWKKKGCSVVPMCWILEVNPQFPVIVSIFHGDGGVAITHSGIEMGQGINTKVAQVCAYKFKIDMSIISIKPYNTNATPNGFASGGSITTEAICAAVIQACDKLNKRLDPIREKLKKENPNYKWADLINLAYSEYVQLVETGFFAPNTGQIKEYKIFGVCYAEVEVDILTGQKIINKLDVYEDLGESMNPILDIGQIEGAVAMGIGYYTTEEIIYSKRGELLTNRTWNYRPPGAKDIAVTMRIKFTDNKLNPLGVLNSKAVAEPPICLTVAIPLAIRQAIGYARKEADSKNSTFYPFVGPITVEHTFMNSLNNYKQYTL